MVPLKLKGLKLMDEIGMTPTQYAKVMGEMRRVCSS
jgi:hypothetical protein